MKTHKNMTPKELEEKLIRRYNAINPEPRTLEERVKKELLKTNIKK